MIKLYKGAMAQYPEDEDVVDFCAQEDNWVELCKAHGLNPSPVCGSCFDEEGNTFIDFGSYHYFIVIDHQGTEHYLQNEFKMI